MIPIIMMTTTIRRLTTGRTTPITRTDLLTRRLRNLTGRIPRGMMYVRTMLQGTMTMPRQGSIAKEMIPDPIAGPAVTEAVTATAADMEVTDTDNTARHRSPAFQA